MPIAAATAGGWPEQRGEQAARRQTRPRRQRRDRCEPLRHGTGAGFEQRRCPCLAQQVGDAGIGFAPQRPLDQRQGGGIGGLKQCLGRNLPFRPIFGEKAERALGGLDGAAHRIVDDDPPQIDRHRGRDRGAGAGIDKARCAADIERRIRARPAPGEELAVVQRIDDRGGARVAGDGQRLHRLRHRIEIGGGKRRERVAAGTRRSGRRQRQDQKGGADPEARKPAPAAPAPAPQIHALCTPRHLPATMS